MVGGYEWLPKNITITGTGSQPPVDYTVTDKQTSFGSNAAMQEAMQASGAEQGNDYSSVFGVLDELENLWRSGSEADQLPPQSNTFADKNASTDAFVPDQTGEVIGTDFTDFFQLNAFDLLTAAMALRSLPVETLPIYEPLPPQPLPDNVIDVDFKNKMRGKPKPSNNPLLKKLGGFAARVGIAYFAVHAFEVWKNGRAGSKDDQVNAQQALGLALGYNAPIIVAAKKYFESKAHAPVTDVELMTELAEDKDLINEIMAAKNNNLVVDQDAQIADIVAEAISRLADQTFGEQNDIYVLTDMEMLDALMNPSAELAAAIEENEEILTRIGESEDEDALIGIDTRGLPLEVVYEELKRRAELYRQLIALQLKIDAWRRMGRNTSELEAEMRDLMTESIKDRPILPGLMDPSASAGAAAENSPAARVINGYEDMPDDLKQYAASNLFELVEAGNAEAIAYFVTHYNDEPMQQALQNTNDDERTRLEEIYQQNSSASQAQEDETALGVFEQYDANQAQLKNQVTSTAATQAQQGIAVSTSDAKGAQGVVRVLLEMNETTSSHLVEPKSPEEQVFNPLTAPNMDVVQVTGSSSQTFLVVNPQKLNELSTDGASATSITPADIDIILVANAVEQAILAYMIANLVVDGWIDPAFGLRLVSRIYTYEQYVEAEGDISKLTSDSNVDLLVEQSLDGNFHSWNSLVNLAVEQSNMQALEAVIRLASLDQIYATLLYKQYGKDGRLLDILEQQDLVFVLGMDGYERLMTVENATNYIRRHNLNPDKHLQSPHGSVQKVKQTL